MPRKILTWGGVAFLVFFIMFRPESASEVFKSLGGGIVTIAESLGEFFTALVG